jgi:hypothetical protein
MVSFRSANMIAEFKSFIKLGATIGILPPATQATIAQAGAGLFKYLIKLSIVGRIPAILSGLNSLLAIIKSKRPTNASIIFVLGNGLSLLLKGNKTSFTGKAFKISGVTTAGLAIAF